MGNLVVLGGGTAGTMIANKLRKRLRRDEWKITVVDRDDVHHYQPGYLFLPFGTYTPEQVVAATAPVPRRTASTSCSARSTGSSRTSDVVLLDGRTRSPTTTWSSPPGTTPRPDQTPGMLGRRVAAEHLRLLHARGRRGARRGAARASTTAGWSCTSPRCRSSARWRRWSSPSWPRPGCASAASATGSSWST